MRQRVQMGCIAAPNDWVAFEVADDQVVITVYESDMDEAFAVISRAMLLNAITSLGLVRDE